MKEVAIAGPDAAPLERVVRGAYRPHVVLAGGPAGDVPLLEGREPVEGRAAAYVCERFACLRPVTEPAELGARCSERQRRGQRLSFFSRRARSGHGLRRLWSPHPPRADPANRPSRVTRNCTTAPLRSFASSRYLSSERLHAFFLIRSFLL